MSNLFTVIIRFCLDRCKAPARTLRLASWRKSRSTENSFEFGNDRDQSCKRCGHSSICRTRPLLLTLLSLGADGPPPHIFSVLRGWSRFLYNARSATKTPCTTKSSTKKSQPHQASSSSLLRARSTVSSIACTPLSALSHPATASATSVDWAEGNRVACSDERISAPVMDCTSAAIAGASGWW